MANKEFDEDAPFQGGPSCQRPYLHGHLYTVAMVYNSSQKDKDSIEAGIVYIDKKKPRGTNTSGNFFL